MILLLTAFPAFAADKESVYDRVIRTGTLRCGYIVYPPETIKDPNTGALSGTVVDMMAEVGLHLDLKIDWVAEVGFADMFEGFKTGKYDALCSGLWKSPARARHALFTIPTNYGVYYAYVRNDDTRFDSGLSGIDDPGVKIAIIDGEYGESVAGESFAKAQTYRLPQLSDISQLLESVAAGKADVVFLQKAPAAGYLAANPGKIRAIDAYPVRVMPAPAVAVPVGEQDLKALLDAAFEFMINNGTVEHILRRYDPALSSYNLIARPYSESR